MKRLILISIILFGLPGCAGGTETGNPSLPTVLGLQARSTDPRAWAVSEGAGGGVIKEAWVSLGEADFLGEGRCDYLGELSYPAGPTLAVVDLAVAGLKVELRLEEASYCGVVLPLDKDTPDLPAAAPDELLHNSVVVTGERDDGVAFRIVYPEQDELELAAFPEPFEVTSEGDALLFSFDVSRLMEGVDLDLVEPGLDGTVLVDEQHNLELLEAFESNLECSLELYRDRNADQAVGPDDLLLAACVEE